MKALYSVVSTFSGAGGSCQGHKMAGLNVLYANEFVEAAQQTYALNHKQTRLDCRDIRKVTAEDILKKTGLKKGELDIFEGSPPCSSFSAAGKGSKGWGEEKSYSDNKKQVTDDLFFEFTRLLSGLSPKCFIAENVEGLALGNARGYFLEILKALEDCGYAVSARILDASYLGVPQKRRRLIFVGVRNDLVKLGFKPSHPNPENRQTEITDVLSNIAKVKDRMLGGKVCYVSADRPFPTITARDQAVTELAKFSSGGWIEDTSGVQRKLTIPEVKALFGFPNSYLLSGDYGRRWERIGRSVPPPMMAAVDINLVKTILEPYYKKYAKTGPLTSDDWQRKIAKLPSMLIGAKDGLMDKGSIDLDPRHDLPYRPSHKSRQQKRKESSNT